MFNYKFIIKDKSPKLNRSKMKKAAAVSLILVMVLMTLSLTGCGRTDGQGTALSTPTTTAATENPATSAETTTESVQTADVTQNETSEENADKAQKFPLKVTDASGFEITLESEPQRIISLTLGSDEMLLGLIGSNRLIALTKYSDDAGISNVSKEAAEIPVRVESNQIEGIIALKPDLVVVDSWMDVNTVKQLRDAGIPVYTFNTPSNIEAQKAVVLELAYVVGADEKGKEIVAWMDSKLNEINDKLKKLKPEQKLSVMDYGEMGSSGKGTNFDDIVTRAGLVNVLARAGMEGWPTVSKEKIIEFNPDIIILPSWYYDPNNSFEGMIETLKNDASLQTVKAISENRLFSVPNPHISSISQYVVLGVEDVAKAAYPELFE